MRPTAMAPPRAAQAPDHDGESPALTVTVAVASDHPLYVDALRRLVLNHSELELVGTTATASGVVELIRDRAPGVLVLDLDLPDGAAHEVMDRMTTEQEPPEVLVLTGTIDHGNSATVVAAGARGLISKTADADRIARAVVSVGDGKTVIGPEFVDGLAAELRARQESVADRFTDREYEILLLLASGQSAPATAAQLHLAVATVRTHLARIYEKLGAANGPAAVAEAFRLGIID